MTGRRVIGMGLLAAAVAAAGCVTLQAQTKPAAAPAAVDMHDTAGHPLVWGGAEPAAPPTLTELEQARVQVVNLLDMLRKALLEADQCRATLAEPRNTVNSQQVANALQLLKADIEHNHPGYTWDAASGTFTKKPDEKPAAGGPPK